MSCYSTSLILYKIPYFFNVCESRWVVSDLLRPHGLYSPWNSPGQNIAVGSCSLLQGIFPAQGLNPGLLHCRWILHQLSYQGSPYFFNSTIYSLLSYGMETSLFHFLFIASNIAVMFYNYRGKIITMKIYSLLESLAGQSKVYFQERQRQNILS